ncbi:MAG TPA: phosphoribosylglycinamide formyltransferase [Pirellulaceae bacterium]|nr:phosphoribosylglycinamide formyltransferase [Pirellulaceae bacterium]
MSTHFPTAVLISGGGTTLRNLIEKERAGELPVEFKLVISSNPQARGLAFAAEANIPSLVVEKKGNTDDEFCGAIFAPIRAAGAELVVMGGFLKHVPIPPDFENRVINIHPALIPAFCGKGLYGLKVHEAALEYGVKVSGCTVHFVDSEYDHGPIILQHTVPVLDGDTPELLQARVFEQECHALPEAIRLIAARRISVEGRLVRIRPVM